MKFAKFLLAAAAAVTLPASTMAQPGPDSRPNGRGIVVPCCTCVDGSTRTINISTGAVAWAISGPGASGNAVALSHPSWGSLGAPWVGPVGGAASAQAGTYTYQINVRVPRCLIGSEITVKGQFLADNSATISLGGSTSGGIYGFKSGNQGNFSATLSASQTISVVVRNEGGPSGMALKGEIVVKCPKGPERRD